jgi:hypothetical protein
MKRGVHRDVDTDTIVCPFNNNNNLKVPAVIRVEKTVKTGFTVGLPIMSEAPKTSMTYFTVYPKETFYQRLEDNPNHNNSGRLALIDDGDVSRCQLSQLCFKSKKNLTVFSLITLGEKNSLAF